MGSPYQSEEVCCFNAGNWNLVRCACYMICTLQERKKKKKNRHSTALAAFVFPLQQQIWYMGSKQSWVNSAWINHSRLSHFMSRCFFSSSSVLSISAGVWEEEDVVNCVRRQLTSYPLPRNWDEQPESGGGYAPTVSVNPDYFNYDTHTKCLYCNFCHELIPCT